MSLFLASASKQHIEFHYRDPVNGLLANVHIASGSQMEIGHGWNREQTAKVIEQLERFGARDAAEAHGSMRGKFLGLLYRDTGVISENEIVTGHEAVVRTQEERSAAEATKAALGFDRGARKEAVRSKRQPARLTETIVQQQLAPGERPTGNEVAMSIQVDPEGRADVALPV